MPNLPLSLQELITANGNIIFHNFTYDDDDAAVSHLYTV